MLAGNNKEGVTYDQLTMGQWVAGFCRTMRDESDKNCKEAMLTYFISLLDDANDFSWSAAKACHAVLLCRMEQGGIKDFTQTEAIESEGYMLKDMSLKVVKIKAKILSNEKRIAKICLVSFLTKVHVCTQVLDQRRSLSSYLFLLFHKEWQSLLHVTIFYIISFRISI